MELMAKNVILLHQVWTRAKMYQLPVLALSDTLTAWRESAALSDTLTARRESLPGQSNPAAGTHQGEPLTAWNAVSVIETGEQAGEQT